MKKSQPDYIPEPPVDKTTLGASMEGHLFDEIKGLIKKAHLETDETKKKALQTKATNLEIQLSLSYETQGYSFLATNVQQAIQKYKNSLSTQD